MPTRQGSFRIFRFAGITVYLHWSWFLVAVIELSQRKGSYESPVWNILEYLSLFLIVMIHEFGHALACRTVGGEADQIVLWPLGGVAYVSPPPRPGATLWTISAGPLVNVALVPLLLGLGTWSRKAGWAVDFPDAARFLHAVWLINLGLLVFNLLPVFPLDGGQILRSLLWFPLGRARSLLVASFAGGLGVLALFSYALLSSSWWLGLIGVFMMMQCWSGLGRARVLARMAKAPRRAGTSCPRCHEAPPEGDFWTCPRCRKSFDMFSAPGACPNCGARFDGVPCFECGRSSSLHEWQPPPQAPIDV